MFCRILCCFVAKSLFYAIYAVLSRNLFCRYLSALAWRKIEPKILSVDKKGQISGMVVGLFLQYCFQANISAGLDSYWVKNETSHSNVTQKQFNLAATKDSVVELL